MRAQLRQSQSQSQPQNHLARLVLDAALRTLARRSPKGLRRPTGGQPSKHDLPCGRPGHLLCSLLQRQEGLRHRFLHCPPCSPGPNRTFRTAASYQPSRRAAEMRSGALSTAPQMAWIAQQAQQPRLVHERLKNREHPPPEDAERCLVHCTRGLGSSRTGACRLSATTM